MNLNDELEIRYAPFFRKKDGSIFFTMPSLYKFGQGKAAVVLNEKKFAELTKKAWEKLLETVQEKFSRQEFELIKETYEKSF